MQKLRPWIPVLVCAIVAAGVYARSARPTRAYCRDAAGGRHARGRADHARRA